MFSVTRPLYQSVYCEKKKFPHVRHKIMRWLICMNIEYVQVLSLLVQRLNIKSESDYEKQEM